MCQLAPVSRAGFYRSLHQAQPLEEEMAVRAEIQHIALAHRRRYGYRRITAELRRQGLLVAKRQREKAENHKCANAKLSQQRGSPHFTVAKLWQNYRV